MNNAKRHTARVANLAIRAMIYPEGYRPPAGVAMPTLCTRGDICGRRLGADLNGKGNFDHQETRAGKSEKA